MYAQIENINDSIIAHTAEAVLDKGPYNFSFRYSQKINQQRNKTYPSTFSQRIQKYIQGKYIFYN